MGGGLVVHVSGFSVIYTLVGVHPIVYPIVLFVYNIYLHYLFTVGAGEVRTQFTPQHPCTEARDSGVHL